MLLRILRLCFDRFFVALQATKIHKKLLISICTFKKLARLELHFNFLHQENVRCFSVSQSKSTFKYHKSFISTSKLCESYFVTRLIYQFVCISFIAVQTYPTCETFGTFQRLIINMSIQNSQCKTTQTSFKWINK